MSTSRRAVPRSNRDPSRQPAPCSRPFLRKVTDLFLLLLGVLILLPSPAAASDPIIVNISLNQVAKGDYFVLLETDGTFLVKADDLQALGLPAQGEGLRTIEGEAYQPLESLPGLSYRFRETDLTLELEADPALLPGSELDLLPERREGVIYSRDNSLFLNYGLDYSAGGEPFGYQGFSLSNELGIRYRDLLFLTDTRYSDSPDQQQFLRLMTSLTHDRRDRLQRLVIGDFFADSGELGSRLNLGGISFAKVYRIDPYYIRYPLFDFSGLLSRPAEVELLVDGQRVRSERFAPGEFTLRNFQGIGGAQTMEVVIRDTLGREQRIASPYYFTDQILRRGLHEYSYNVGLLRRDFGLRSHHYGELAFSGFHRYGVSDRLNLGISGEAGDGVASLAGELAWKVGGLGLLRLQGAGSHSGEGGGLAGFVSYDYQNRRFRSRFALQGFSEPYRSVDQPDDAGRRQYNLLAGIGYSTPKLGSLALDFARSAVFHEPDRQTLTLSWARRIAARLYANARLSRISDQQDVTLAELTVSWYLGSDSSVTAAVSRDRDGNGQVLTARKNTPVGYGTGWEVRAERSTEAGDESYLLNTLAQHNARNAILRGDFSLGRSENIATEDLRVSLSGALVAIGNRWALTRPVHDSFALVSVGEAEGVGVSVNGQLSGTTDHRGQIVVPELSAYYDNQVSIEARDISLDLLMPSVRLFLSPPLRSGSCLNFPLQKYQAYHGRLVVDGAAGPEPLVDAEITLRAPTGNLLFWTSADGEFYLDNQQVEVDPLASQGCQALTGMADALLPPGEYPLRIRTATGSVASSLRLPAVDEQFADLGELKLIFKSSDR